MTKLNLKSKIHKAVSIALISAGFIPASHAAETNVNINNPTGTTIDGTTAVTFNNGASFTVDNDGTIAGTNTNTAYGIRVLNSSTISSLTNSGTISGTATTTFIGTGIEVTGAGSTINTVVNEGIISGSSAAVGFGDAFSIRNNATINSLTNSGTISSTSSGAFTTVQTIAMDTTATLTNLTNSGTISATSLSSGGTWAVVADDNSILQNLTNSGNILSTSDSGASQGIVLIRTPNGTDNLINTKSGIISSTTGAISANAILIQSNSTVTNLVNEGDITATAGDRISTGIYIGTSAEVTNLTNSGTISASSTNDTSRGLSFGGTSGGTLTTLTNSGTISGSAGTDSGFGIRLISSSTIGTLTNSGTISGSAGNDTGQGILLSTNSTITTLTNDGTISGTAGNDNGDGIRVRSSTLTTLTNNGTISATSVGDTAFGVGFIAGNNTTITNNGTISGISDASSGFGVRLFQTTTTDFLNTGTITGTAVTEWGTGIRLTSSTITTLTNTGTITGTAPRNGSDIFVDGTSNLVNFNNLQSDLTYSGRLPSNYSTIIRDLDNYGSLVLTNTPAAPAITESATGDTVYTPFAGTTTAAVYIKEGTYSSVMTGMPDGNLSDTVTGTLTGDGVNSVGNATWTLTENGTNVWDLSVVGNYAFIDRTNTQLAFNNIASNIGEVFQNMSAGGNFAHMMTYDCNSFGNGGCVSFGGRITNSGGNDHSGTLVLGKKFSDNFRLSGFVDQSIDHNSYTDIQVESNVPLIGLTGVWNKDKDNQGLQVKVGNTYQSNDTDITRQIVGANNFSERAKGDTTVETQSYIAEASYQITDSITSHRPFVAVRYMQTEMDGYTETNAAAPITYQDMSEESYVAIAGVKTSKIITPEVTLNLGFGLETDLNHNDAQLQGRVVGLSAFNAAAISSDPENSTRQLASIGADFNLVGGHKIGVKGMYQELRYRKDDATTVHVSYTLPF
jgi:hypothetical protein